MDFGILARCLGFQIAVSDVSFQQLLEARLAIETAALELICGKLTEEHFSELEQLVDCARRDESAEEVTRNFQTDQSFHRALLKTSGNQVLISFAILLGIFFSRAFPKLGTAESIVAAAEHRLLLEALRSNNLDLARGIMKQHLDRYRRNAC
jgi:DNA-binding GntR family transcriptional regulator